MMQDEACPGPLTLIMAGLALLMSRWVWRDHHSSSFLVAMLSRIILRRASHIGIGMIGIGIVILSRKLLRNYFIKKGSTVVKASLKLRDLKARYGIEIPEDPCYSTVGGFMLEHLDENRRIGDSVDFGGYRFIVTEMDREFIARLKIESLTTASLTHSSATGASS